VLGGIKLPVDRKWIGDEYGSGQGELVGGGHDPGHGRRVGHRPVELEPGVGQPEAGEGTRTEPENGDAQRLHPLEGGGDVEDGLDARGTPP
jgi:hypothetical protein